MCQRSVKITCFLRYFSLCFLILNVTNLPHEIDTISYHNQDNTHIFCKGQQKISEVFTLNNRCFLIKCLNTYKPMDNLRYTITIQLTDFIKCKDFLLNTLIQKNCNDRVTIQTDILNSNGCSL